MGASKFRQQTHPPSIPFNAKDWSTLRSARATAVSRDGLILYQVGFGGEKGPNHSEWWTISANGTNPAKLELSEDFSPFGFSADGSSLYGKWKLNKLQQLAVFRLVDHKAASVPSTSVLLPRGIETAVASPDGKHFAIVADPRPFDSLEDVRHVIECRPVQPVYRQFRWHRGQWWCSDLRSIANEMAWSADGTSIAVLSQLPHIGYHRVSTAIDVCSASTTRHVTDVPNSGGSIAWADGGKEIAFLSTKSEVLTPEHVWTVASAGGSAEDRTPQLQGTAFSLAGDPQARVWVSVGHGVQSDLEEFRDGELKTAYRWQQGFIAGLPVRSDYAQASGQIAFNVDDPDHAMNVAVPDGDHLLKITHEGDGPIAEDRSGPSSSSALEE